MTWGLLGISVPCALSRAVLAHRSAPKAATIVRVRGRSVVNAAGSQVGWSQRDQHQRGVNRQRSPQHAASTTPTHHAGPPQSGFHAPSGRIAPATPACRLTALRWWPHYYGGPCWVWRCTTVIALANGLAIRRPNSPARSGPPYDGVLRRRPGWRPAGKCKSDRIAPVTPCVPVTALRWWPHYGGPAAGFSAAATIVSPWQTGWRFDGPIPWSALAHPTTTPYDDAPRCARPENANPTASHR